MFYICSYLYVCVYVYNPGGFIDLLCGVDSDAALFYMQLKLCLRWQWLRFVKVKKFFMFFFGF